MFNPLWLVSCAWRNFVRTEIPQSGHARRFMENHGMSGDQRVPWSEIVLVVLDLTPSTGAHGMEPAKGQSEPARHNIPMAKS